MNEHNEIRSDAAYPAKEFCRRTKMSIDRIRQHVPVRRLAGRTYVLGSDFIEHLKRQPKLMPQPKSIDRLLARTEAGAGVSP